MDIIAFISARLDEDERRYQRLVYGDTHWEMLRTSAHLGSWTYSRQNGIDVATNDAVMDAGLARMRKTLDGWQRDHAKQWLADVKAKRAIVADNPRSPLLDMTDQQLHERFAHPAYEYATTQGQRKAWDYSDVPPEGEGWERNVDSGNPGEGWERFDYHEESYWRRLNPAGPQPPYIPKVLRHLAAVDADHPDYNPDWAVEHG